MNEIDRKKLVLSKSRQDEIRAEEIFRIEIQEQIAAEKPSSNLLQRIWNSRNSAFALWFLSSVLIASLSWGYTQWETARSEQQEEEAAFKDRIISAAESLEMLGDAIETYHNRVDQYIGKEIRRQERNTRFISMLAAAEDIKQEDAEGDHTIESIQKELSDADFKAEWLFKVWVDIAKGPDIESRTRFLESFSEHRIKSKNDQRFVDVIPWKSQDTFIFVPDAVRLKVMSEKYDTEIERLSELVSNRIAQMKFASRDFSLINGPDSWIDEDSIIKEELQSNDFKLLHTFHNIFVAIQSGTYESMDVITQLMQENLPLETGRNTVFNGLIEYVLSQKKLHQAWSQREMTRFNFLSDSQRHFLNAIDTAEELDRAVLEELEQLESGAWHRGFSNIPGRSENLGRQIERMLAVNDQVPDEIKILENEAITEINESRAFLEKILSRK